MGIAMTRRNQAASTQREPLAQIKAPDLHVVAQLMGSAGEDDLPFGNNVRPVGDAQRLTNVVICDQNPDPAGLQIEDDLLQLKHRNGIDAAEGLIKQDKTGLNAKATRNLNAAPFAA